MARVGEDLGIGETGTGSEESDIRTASPARYIGALTSLRYTPFTTNRSSAEVISQARRVLRRIRWDKRAAGDLWHHIRISKFGRKRYRSHDSRGVLPGKRPISERALEVELRQSVGHREGDTVMGSDMRHCVLTLVDRKTGFSIIKKLLRECERQPGRRMP